MRVIAVTVIFGIPIRFVAEARAELDVFIAALHAAVAGVVCGVPSTGAGVRCHGFKGALEKRPNSWEARRIDYDIGFCPGR